ncbi:TonB-dependent receptor [Novosphingobium aromaticivorans DSM 12444]|uniref:TonB-dependent receptor n=1 Tax=Novosphingobium aromaticivorans (strain ATCC 700278 / DSM 12444 / CCUG 56034 / CIP 105152 / NBRC 16084 / F199) TaxID=279238 RepID=Q2G7S1_NOVAD|nr:TonB-dependent receptor [Novosphingobium aromaticivorans]ABD26102.1 TonB-dependent receptor [Novosphingobium aromaticivorans DSM 12444]SCY59435.1 Outer membrane receptor for ferrienterochelin and colicins [Novosphingobium aromaticivorans]
MRPLARPFFLIATLAPCAAHAQDAVQPEIVVIGTGLQAPPSAPAYNVQQIDRERLLETASGRLEDALSSVAGFQQFRRSDSRSSNPSAQGVTLRSLGGNATSRTLVLLDGVPMADPFFGHIPFSAIAPERLATARVTRGGGAGAFGAGAVAGTVELESANADQLGLVQAGALANDRGETELSGALAPRVGKGFAVISGRWDRGQGFWTTPVGQRVPISARARYDSWSAGLRLVAPLSTDVELQMRGLLFDDRRTLRFRGADTSSSGQDASLRLVGRGAWAFDVLAYVQARDFTNVVISSTSFRKTLDQRATPSTGVGGKAELRPPVGGNHVLRLGADYRLNDGDMAEDAYSAATGLVTARRRAGGKTSDLGLFLEDDWTLGRLVLNAGARADRWTIRDGYFLERSPSGATTIDSALDPAFADRSGWQASFRGGAVFRATDMLSLRAAGYTGLRLPTLNELYRSFSVVAPRSEGGIAITATQRNPLLHNEKLEGFEAGLDFTPAPGLAFNATAFDNRIRNAIANVTLGTSGNTTTRKRQNVDAVHARGLEFGARLRAGAISLDGSLAWTDAEVEASGISASLDGKRPAQTPRWAGTATLAWRPAERWSLGLTLRHVGAQFEDDLETDLLPSATTLDGFAQLPLHGPISLVLRGENLTGETIVTRLQDGSMDIGTPRTFWAGIRVEVR